MEGIMLWIETNPVLAEVGIWSAYFTLIPLTLKGIWEAAKWLWRWANVY